MPNPLHHLPLNTLPPEIDYVWHGANEPANLAHFLNSTIEWVEIDVNLTADGNGLILRHDSYAKLPAWVGEEPIDLQDALEALMQHNKRIKIDFKVGGKWIDRALELVDALMLPQPWLWLNADFDIFGRERISELAARYPAAVVQVPIHSIADRTTTGAELVDAVNSAATLGINRFSIGYHYPAFEQIYAAVSAQGFESNIYGIADLAEFQAAIALKPRSITADFNFPEWYLYGRGSGHGGKFYVYTTHFESVVLQENV